MQTWQVTLWHSLNMTRALITGASAGLGEEFARQLAQSGHDLVLVARDGSRLESLANQLRAEHGVDVEVLVADLADRAQLSRVEQRCTDDARPIDVLINNAGLGVKERFTKSDVQLEQMMIDVMVTAVMRLSHAVLPSMLRRNTGAIMVVSSVAGWMTGSTYNAAKAWATTFTEGLAGLARGSKVRVTALCPGFTHTEFHQRAGMKKNMMPAWMWVDADRVVRESLTDMLQGKLISVPSRRYKVLSFLVRALPRPAVRSISERRYKR